MKNHIAVWLQASRPKTLWAAVAPVIMGTAMAGADGVLHWPSALAALLGAVLIQIGTNFANDYFDFLKGADAGPRLGPVRATQAGLVSPRAMRTAFILAFGLAFCIGIYLVWRGGWPIVVIGLSSILFGILYTATPLALAYLGIADLFVLIFFGPVAVGGTYFVQALDITPTVLIAGLAPGFISTAILTVNNLRDIDGDRAAGKKTLVVRFGKTFARFEYLFSLIAACLIPVYLFFTGKARAAALTVLLILPLAYPAIKTIFSGAEGRVLNEVLAATGKLLLFYSIFFAIGWLW